MAGDAATTGTQALPLRVVLHEGGGSRQLQPERRAAVLRALLSKGYSVTCPKPENGAGDGRGVAAADQSDLLVLRESDNGARGDHTSDGETPAGNVTVHFRDIRGSDPEAVVALVDALQEEKRATRPGAWQPWFPVIDFDRCTNCMQCLTFCLFDVYGVDADKNIQVRQPQNCKTNCPACSRVCPEVAILFPKYRSAPINGAEVQAEDVQHEKMKTDVSALLGGDIYQMLRERHKRAETRFAKERDSGKALKERMKCLKKLQGGLGDIPPEVLMALPSAAEIQKKAAEAEAKAQQVLAERAELLARNEQRKRHEEN